MGTPGRPPSLASHRRHHKTTVKAFQMLPILLFLPPVLLTYRHGAQRTILPKPLSKAAYGLLTHALAPRQPRLDGLPILMLAHHHLSTHTLAYYPAYPQST